MGVDWVIQIDGLHIGNDLVPVAALYLTHRFVGHRFAAGKRPISRIVRSVVPNSNAPASDVIAPPSNPATTVRPSTAVNSNSPALHSVGIGALLESREVILAKQLSLIRRPDALFGVRYPG
jgi:hypothetical protein